jgi:hypothetical protein
MDADTLRKNVWEEMLYASMRSNYFAELVRHYLGVDRGLRVGVLVATSGTVATALSDSGAAKIVVPIVAAVASFWLLISQYGSMARDAADLHEGWVHAAGDPWRVLPQWSFRGNSNTNLARDRSAGRRRAVTPTGVLHKLWRSQHQRMSELRDSD